ncbi:glycosyltransferase family 1 protein [Podospora didyma]|uniref:Glycosyltransferase family 1 protein n=1 Tax=Podospora didyma TaxID=330526 RepID=A0AAE0K5E7_9PEZI|nr:glycosyltransferase family 1 protein [Podospora didyma]
MAQTNGKHASVEPVIVAAAFPAFGHSGGPAQICNHLSKKGYKVYFISSPDFKKAAEHNGVDFVVNTYWPRLEYFQEREQIPDPHKRIISDFKAVFGEAIPPNFKLLKETLARARVENPSAPIVILHEVLYQGLLPFLYGAPLPDGFDALPPIVNFSTSNNFASDPMIPPFGPSLPYALTEENIALWAQIRASMKPSEKELNDHYNAIMKDLGSTQEMTGWLWDTVLEIGAVTLFPASASTDYPHTTDVSKRYKYIGGLPLKPLGPDYQPPEWWPLITDNAALPDAERKKVVFVTQGTVSMDYTQLITPTIRALSNRDDLIVVVTLGARGATLPVDEQAGGIKKLPDNTKVVDFIPYDLVLKFADLFVSNAGYNGYMHGVMNGVPQVLSGMDADKGEVSQRAEYSGVAVNLHTQTPTEEAILAGVEKILKDGKYAKRAAELKKENEDLSSLGTVERIINELAEGKYSVDD